MLMVCAANISASWFSPTGVTGWSTNAGGSNPTFFNYYKVAASGDLGATVTCAQNGAAAPMLQFIMAFGNAATVPGAAGTVQSTTTSASLSNGSSVSSAFAMNIIYNWNFAGGSTWSGWNNTLTGAMTSVFANGFVDISKSTSTFSSIATGGTNSANIGAATTWTLNYMVIPPGPQNVPTPTPTATATPTPSPNPRKIRSMLVE